MKVWKKLSIALLALLVLSQIPFAYRRYKLSHLKVTIQQLNSQRIPSLDSSFTEYKGVIHVHSFLGGHSSGSFQEIIEAAKANELQFVVMTEHPAKEFNTAEMTLKGEHAAILFVNGNEAATIEGDRLLVVPGDVLTGLSSNRSTRSVIEQAKCGGKLTVVAYPEDFKSWDIDGYDALEVYNVYTNARRINPIIAFFDTLWSYRSYRDLLFANFYTRPSSELAKWDDATCSRRVTGLAGNDAHSNIGLSLNDSAGRTLLGVKLDPYATSFHLVRVHALIPQGSPLEETTLVEALKMGHCFIGFDLFGDTSGFSFTAKNSVDRRIQGDEIALVNEVHLSVSLPIPATIVLFKDGKSIQEESGTSKKEFVVDERGTYRVEAYLPQLGHSVSEQPWIISNPIYVR